MDAPNKIAAGNRHRAFSFDRAMKFGYHRCNQRQSTVRWRCLSSNVDMADKMSRDKRSRASIFLLEVNFP